LILIILALFVWTAFFESRMLTLPLLSAMIEWRDGVALLLPREEAMIAITHVLGDWIHSHLS
jgi:hypothetical protein